MLHPDWNLWNAPGRPLDQWTEWTGPVTMLYGMYESCNLATMPCDPEL